MSFVDTFQSTRWESLLQASNEATPEDVRRALAQPRPGLQDFAALISPAAASELETLSRRSMALTRQRFGTVMRFFAPLYLSNECINNCAYCGFSRDNPILRVTLKEEEVLREGLELQRQGFRNILLVAGEHPKFVSNGYMERCVATLHPHIPSLSLEVGPMETDEYRPMVQAGAEGLVVYQETYDREIYTRMHTAGPKKNFDWRLETPERAYQAGFRRLGIGALFGLADWRYEALCVAAHASYLLRHCWRAQVTLSMPRLRPCAGEFQPLTHMSDRELVQLTCAFRLALPDVGIVLSTREPAWLRDGLFPLGVTMISAGSHTEPGGYTGAGADELHITRRGRIEALDSAETSRRATGQFDIADNRSPAEVAEKIRSLGYEPVWKDWDEALAPTTAQAS